VFQGFFVFTGLILLASRLMPSPRHKVRPVIFGS